MKNALVSIIGLATFLMTTNSFATLCKEVTNGNNSIVVERKAFFGSELSFWLWPNRSAIRFESSLDVSVTDAAGAKSAKTEEFYIYGINEKDYSDCIRAATEASKTGSGIRVTVENAAAGYYDYPSCTGQNAWAAFVKNGQHKVTCEVR